MNSRTAGPSGWAGAWRRLLDGNGRERSKALRSIDGQTIDGQTDRMEQTKKKKKNPGGGGPPRGVGWSMLRIHSPGCVPLLDWFQACCQGTALWALALLPAAFRAHLRRLEAGALAGGHRSAKGSGARSALAASKQAWPWPWAVGFALTQLALRRACLGSPSWGAKPRGLNWSCAGGWWLFWSWGQGAGQDD